MHTRLLEERDIEAAAAIVGKNYNPEYEQNALDEIRQMFAPGVYKPKYYVAEDNDTVIAFAGFIQSWMDYTLYEVFWVNVDPEHQRKGVGKQIVGKIIEEIRISPEARMIVLSTSKPEFYQKHFGFRFLGEVPDAEYQILSLSLI